MQKVWGVLIVGFSIELIKEIMVALIASEIHPLAFLILIKYSPEFKKVETAKVFHVIPLSKLYSDATVLIVIFPLELLQFG
jgi:hypothetical protein